jgi:TfoX/Sxy family transcriptional regulator of competence genes
MSSLSPESSPIPSTNVPSGYTGSYPVKNAFVARMQEAIKKIADAVMADAYDTKMAPQAAVEKPTEIGSTKAKPGANLGAQKKGFADFIAENYVGQLPEDYRGTSWSTGSGSTYETKKPTESNIYELDVVMNTLSRIGKSTNELKPDGIWSFRTDNALRNIMGFAYSLLQLEGDFGLKNNIYVIGNWNAFTHLLSGYEVDPTTQKNSLSDEEKTKRSQQITMHLDAIRKLYLDFKQQVLNHPEHRKTIEGHKSFYNTSKMGLSNEQYSGEKLTNSNKAFTVNLPYWSGDKKIHQHQLKFQFQH